MFWKKKRVRNGPVSVSAFRPEFLADSAEPYYTKTRYETGIQHGCFVPRRPEPPRLTGSLITGITPFNKASQTIKSISEFTNAAQTQGCFLFKAPDRLRATINEMEPVLAAYLNNGRHELANHLLMLKEATAQLVQFAGEHNLQTKIPVDRWEEFHRQLDDTMSLVSRGYIPLLVPPTKKTKL